VPAVSRAHDHAPDRWWVVRTGLCAAPGVAHLPAVSAERYLRRAARYA